MEVGVGGVVFRCRRWGLFIWVNESVKCWVFVRCGRLVYGGCGVV